MSHVCVFVLYGEGVGHTCMHTCTGLDEKYVFLLLPHPFFAPDRLAASDIAYFEAYFEALESSGMLKKRGKTQKKNKKKTSTVSRRLASPSGMLRSFAISVCTQVLESQCPSI
jgi:hypothetical protein